MFDLEAFLESKRGLVESRLVELMDGAQVAAPMLKEAMAYSLFAGGKRLRPILLLAAHEVFSPAGSYALDAACAIEMLHTYSLIHDDLPSFDDDDLRRGKPTCHVRYGEWLAILAGDALNTFAFGLLVGGPDDVPPERKLEAVGVVAAAAGAPGMVAGQALDMAFEGGGAGEEEVRLMQQLKTGKMISASAEVGALLADAGDEARRRMKRYGELIGLAFQIRDDLLDISGLAEELGKSPGKDGSAGKATLPALIGESRARREAEHLVSEAVAALEPFGGAAEPLRGIAAYAVARRR